MNVKLTALRNIGSNWFGATVAVVVGFFISPFILHHLGDAAFGLWILIFSLTGYYGIFDFGIRSSVIKYVAEFKATGDRERLVRVLNISLFIYSGLALLLLAVSAVCAMLVNHIFHLAPDFLQTARWLVLIVGSGVAVAFPLSVFAGAMEGLQKFQYLNMTQAAANVLRALLIVLALENGLGLLTVALITVAMPVLSYVVYGWHVRSSLGVLFGRQFLDRATLRQMFHYSSFTFLSQLARRLRFQSDAIVIGAMMSASAITYFSIGSKLVSYSTVVVSGMSPIFTPLSSQFDAAGDRGRLRKLFVQGNRACAFAVFPIAAVLLILGKPLIDVWVGARYESSYVVLVILLIPSVLQDIQTSSRQVLYGMARHKALAIVNMIEGVVNLVLSIILIHYWGIVGDAIGTAGPLLLNSTLFLPLYLCRLLEVRVRDFLKDAYLMPLALTVPLAIVLLWLRHVLRPHNYLQLAAEVAAGGVVYGAGLLWVFFTREAEGVKLRSRLKNYVLQARSRT